jgi:hypothetical protein
MSCNVLVTGASGFIGQAVVAALAKKAGWSAPHHEGSLLSISAVSNVLAIYQTRRRDGLDAIHINRRAGSLPRHSAAQRSLKRPLMLAYWGRRGALPRIKHAALEERSARISELTSSSPRTSLHLPREAALRKTSCRHPVMY